MSRHPATPKWVGPISIAVVLTLAAACSKPNSEPAQEAGSAQAVEAAPTPVAANPEAPAAVADAPSPTSAPEPESAPAQSSPPAPAEPVVAPAPEPAAQADNQKAPSPEAAPDALKWLQESEKRRVEYEKNLAELAGKLETAKSDLVKSQRDLLAFRNPYLARPVLSQEEAAKTQGLNGSERVQWAEARVATSIAEVEAAQKAYDDAKANPPTN